MSDYTSSAFYSENANAIAEERAYWDAIANRAISMIDRALCENSEDAFIFMKRCIFEYSKRLYRVVNVYDNFDYGRFYATDTEMSEIITILANLSNANENHEILAYSEIMPEIRINAIRNMIQDFVFDFDSIEEAETLMDMDGNAIIDIFIENFEGSN